MAQVCRAGKVAKGTCANKNNNAMKDKTDNKAQVRCAQKLCGILATRWGMIAICSLLFLVGCQSESKQTNSFENKSITTNTNKIVFVPDTVVNGKLILDDYLSLENFYPTITELKLTEFVRESPVVVFCNASKTEYLLAYQYEGNTKNSFSCFEIVGNDEKIKDCILLNSYSEFKTESELRLGLTLKEVESIKGTEYKKQGDKIRYQISEPNSTFLQSHNMPSYFLECELLQDKVIKIKFGFDYP